MQYRTFYFLAITGTLCGCATSLPWRQRAGLDYFVAKDTQTLIRSLGQPTRSWQHQGSNYVAYDYVANVWTPGEPGIRDQDSEAPTGPWIDHRNCSTVFEIQESEVTAWSLDGDACRDAPYPRVRSFASAEMAIAEKKGFEVATQFPHDPFTGYSSVSYGAFYEK